MVKIGPILPARDGRGIARISQGGGGGHTLSHPGYLHSPLQMFGPENEVCNYLALEKIHGMLILWIQVFFFYLKNYLTKGFMGTPVPPWLRPWTALATYSLRHLACSRH